jgi:ubiquinone/menaquinone biosynthesis C-methylase UbiE
VFSAAQLTKEDDNIRISHASVDRIPFADASFDLVFSLGVLHHIPDTQKAMEQAVAKVKP